MGGLAVSNPADTFCIITNPAGLSLLTDNRIDLDGLLQLTSGSVDVAANHLTNPGKETLFSENDMLFGGNIGYSHQFDAPVTFGIAAVQLAAHSHYIDMFPPALPFNFNVSPGGNFRMSNLVVGSWYESYRFAPAISHRPLGWFMWGLALNFDYTITSFKTTLKNKPIPRTYGFDDHDYGATNSNQIYFIQEPTDAWGAGATLGLLFIPQEWLRIGISGTSPSLPNTHTTKAKAYITFRENYYLTYDKGPTVQGGNKFALPTPAKVSGGASFSFSDLVVFGADATYTNWSWSFAGVDMDFAGYDINFPLGWVDQWVIAAGGMLHLPKGIAMRGGYNYASTLIRRDEHIGYVYPSYIKHHLTVGGGMELPWFAFNLGYEYGMPMTVNPNKNSHFGHLFHHSQVVQQDQILSAMISVDF